MRIGYDVDGWGSRAFCKDLDFVGSYFFLNSKLFMDEHKVPTLFQVDFVRKIQQKMVLVPFLENDKILFVI